MFIKTIKLLFFIIILSSANIYAQQSKHQASAHLVTGLDKFSYQIVNIYDNRDEYLSNNSIGLGLTYSYKLFEKASIISSFEFQKMDGSVNAAESDYLTTKNRFYSIGFQFDLIDAPLYFDLEYLFVTTKFNYSLNNDNKSNRSMGHGLKLGLNYSYWISKSMGIKVGLYSNGVAIGNVDLDNSTTSSKYHDSSMGVITSMKIGYIVRF